MRLMWHAHPEVHAVPGLPVTAQDAALPPAGGSMNEFTVIVDVKMAMTSQHAIESLLNIEQAAREAANRLHISWA
jgi:hypothetical protein